MEACGREGMCGSSLFLPQLEDGLTQSVHHTIHQQHIPALHTSDTHTQKHTTLT